MTAKISVLRKSIRKTLENVNREISILASDGRYAAGLASEGYAGGYRDALYDVEAVLNGVPPSNSRYWKPEGP